MTLPEALAVVAAGTAAGAVNTIVGSGSLVTFPVLLAVGYPSVTANVSNTVGLVPGGVSGVIGYRRELRGQERRSATLAIGTSIGALTGGILLLALPPKVFQHVVPVLILLACGLMAIRPKPQRTRGSDRPRLAFGGALLTGVYGGYFGAAQGVILLALLRLFFSDDLQRLNAVKNVLAGVANTVAAALFIVVAHVAWAAAGLVAIGSTVGAQLGARYGRRLHEETLRRIVIVGGTVVAIVLLVK